MRKSENIVTRELFGKSVLMPIESGADGVCVYELNETGSFLWKELEKYQTLAEMVKDLEENFDVDPLTAQKDVESFMAGLREINAV